MKEHSLSSVSKAVAARADVHDDVWPSLAGGTYAVPRGEGNSSFAHLIEPGIPQGDFGGRVRRNRYLEPESPAVKLPRRAQRPVDGLEGCVRTRETGARSWGDA